MDVVEVEFKRECSSSHGCLHVDQQGKVWPINVAQGYIFRHI